MDAPRLSRFVLGLSLVILALTLLLPAALLAGTLAQLFIFATSGAPRLQALQGQGRGWPEAFLLGFGLVALAVVAALLARLFRAAQPERPGWLRRVWWLAGALFVCFALLPEPLPTLRASGALAVSLWGGLTVAAFALWAGVQLGALVQRRGAGSTLLVGAVSFLTLGWTLSVVGGLTLLSRLSQTPESLSRLSQASESLSGLSQAPKSLSGLNQAPESLSGLSQAPESLSRLRGQESQTVDLFGAGPTQDPDAFNGCLKDFYANAALVEEANREARRVARSPYGDTVVPEVLWKVCLRAPLRDFRSMFLKVLYREARRERRPVDACDVEQLPVCPIDEEPDDVSEEEAAVYERALCTLDREDRVLWDERSQGKSWADIADRLRVSEAAARQRGHRAKKQICEQIRTLCPLVSQNVCR